MKYRVRHVTTYRYEDPVDLGSHMLHLSPRDLPHQAVLASRIVASPEPARSSARLDHFGNAVTWMFMDRPHDRFVVTLDATVDVLFPSPGDPARSLPWEAVAAAARAGGAAAWQAAEFIYDSPMLPAELGAGGYAAASFPPGRPILTALIDLNGRIRRDFAFRGGVTTISTPVARVLAQRAGVCQDFSHLMIAGLRALGIPARYVSGYLRTKPPPGVTGRRGADQSHAWVGAWLGPGQGWVDLDPTNDLVVRDEHVVLAWGRDYGDISPVRGMILGGGHHTVSVGVDLDPV
jgi:transglutaminase-like putative cysteine protease